MAGAGLEDAQLAVADGDEARGGDAGAAQEGGVLEGAGLLEAHVEVVVGVGDEDPDLFLLLLRFLTLLRFGVRVGGSGGRGFAAVEEVVEGGVAVRWCCCGCCCWRCGG